jgi:hypothetical protein
MKRPQTFVRVEALTCALTLLCISVAAHGATYPTNACVSKKQTAAATACQQLFAAWATWEADPAKDPGDTKLTAAIAKAQTKLASAWDKAEAAALKKGVDCAQTTLSSTAIQTNVADAVSAIVTTINDGVDFGNKTDRTCRAKLLKAAATACSGLLKAEAKFVNALAKDPGGNKRDSAQTKAIDKFNAAWTKASCSTVATMAGVAAQLSDLSDDVVTDTTVSPNVDDTQFITIAPTGTITYEKKQLTPQCIHGQPYIFFAKRGSVNKLVMYYQGGGACWEQLTCGIPVCDQVSDEGDNPNNASGGFADLSNPDNPFRDWNVVFVSYCSCDVHFGQSDKQYTDALLIHHRGYDNARVVEKWAREHFVNPDVIFITGSSAGAYGAWFHGALLQSVWPASRLHVLADAGNGVITQDFLEQYFPNWNFEANLPANIPGVQEAIESGTGIVGYTEAVAKFFPATTWAHYTTAFDGNFGGQTGFYNVMLNNNDPAAALSWWNGSCQFNQVMTQQAQDTAAALTATNNYRYYIGTGSRHTMWGSDKVYTDTTGGVPTIVDWINGMLASTPPSANDPAWSNVECTNCGLLLPGDPRPNPLQSPFQQVGPDVVIQCSP